MQTGSVRRGAVYVVLVLVAGWHAIGLWQRVRPITPLEATARLRAGLDDQVDRRRCLEALRDNADADGRSRVLAVAACIALDDRDAYARLLPGLGPERAVVVGDGAPWPSSTEVEAFVQEASLGEHWLRHFLLGQWLRASGDPRARAEFEAAVGSARWSDATLGGELAHAALTAIAGTWPR